MNIPKNFIKKTFSKEKIVSLIIIVGIFITDRLTKINVIEQQLNSNSQFINDYLNFDLVWNTGIGFGLFSQNANIYYHATTFLIFLVIVFLSNFISKANVLNKALYSLVLGGALGNFYDRLFYFAVPDFIDIHINDFHWFTFNIADIFISVGIVLIIINDYIINKK